MTNVKVLHSPDIPHRYAYTTTQCGCSNTHTHTHVEVILSPERNMNVCVCVCVLVTGSALEHGRITELVGMGDGATGLLQEQNGG